jgi:hypothetical protein
VTLKGARDRDGLIVDQALGFTAKAVTPAFCWGLSLGGSPSNRRAISPKSDRQFSLILSDSSTIQSWKLSIAGATRA